jgi:alpha-galactosidase
MNVKPGLWFRPLTTHNPVPEALLLKSKFSEALYVKEQMRTLDPTVADVTEQIRNDVKRLCSWRFQLLKHDFSTYDLFGLWGFQMGSDITDSQWHFADRTRTNAEITRALYATLREAAGTTPLLGCNTIGQLSVELFEVRRTGDDSSGRDWAGTRKMGVNTLAFRSPQQGVFFDVDADCLGLTKAIPWSLNRQWLDLPPRSGTPEQRKALRQAFSSAAIRQPVCEPLDWLHLNEPEQWRLGSKVSHFDWYSQDISIPL